MTIGTPRPSAGGGTASPRRVSGFTAACVLVGNVIGTGIFTTTGFMARDLGDPGLILALWFVGALLALAGAISYSELGAAMPQAGGDYIYLRQAYGPFMGFLTGWASFTVGFGAAIAAGAVSFASYLLQLFPLGSESSLVPQLLALALIWIVTGFHLAGTGPGGFLQRLLTILKMVAILMLVVGGFAFGHGRWDHLSYSTPSLTPGLGTMIVSLIFVTYAYSGWNVAGYIAGEIADPGRNIPRTMIWGTLFVGFVYLLVNLVYIYALPVTALGQPPVLPIAQKASVAMFGPAGARFVAVMLCISIVGAVSAMVWAGPRIYYAMARDGVFPAMFAHTRDDSGTPGKSIILQSAWASLLVLSASFEQLVIYSGVVLAIFSAIAVGAVMVLRWRSPELIRPYRVPLYPLVPCFYVALSAVIVFYTAVERPTESALAVASVAAGVPFYLFWRRSLRSE